MPCAVRRIPGYSTYNGFRGGHAHGRRQRLALQNRAAARNVPLTVNKHNVREYREVMTELRSYVSTAVCVLGPTSASRCVARYALVTDLRAPLHERMPAIPSTDHCAVHSAPPSKCFSQTVLRRYCAKVSASDEYRCGYWAGGMGSWHAQGRHKV